MTSFDECVLVGYWLGDGSWATISAARLTVNRDEESGIRELLKRLGRPHTTWLRKNTNKVIDFNLQKSFGLRALELGFKLPLNTYNKAISELLFKEENYVPLLTGLWMADGSTKEAPYYTTVSPVLAGQMDEMLETLDFEPNHKIYRREGNRAPAHQIYLSRKEKRRFLARFPFWGPKAASSSLIPAGIVRGVERRG